MGGVLLIIGIVIAILGYLFLGLVLIMLGFVLFFAPYDQVYGWRHYHRRPPP